ncbi:ketopantoate reductase [Haloarcula vallismortis]|uniref:2-dehydropantoate 2-reductase n=2 Tax=Haloarcula vallismortis TaxID=28442 RepID=M0JJE1_HALVA|nr:2-dehydropantoate 2-reductase [Haloarcula vallismortis]EMA08079.1 2-dehydropantoate 2-reductase [Haloarcula vallismortis ATCC 29715]SDX30626.1 ketopantoate reductase [Haloarcula vallismortis]
MKLCIFGVGGIGGYLGARLADAGHEVHLIARGEHLAALQSDGLRVESIHGDTAVDLPATDEPAEVGPCDAVLLCVKSNDTRAAAADMAPLLREGTAVVSFQNGVDNEAWLAETIDESHVVGGVAYIFSTIKEPGIVEHTGGPARFVYGELDGRRTERIESLDDALSASEGIDAVLADDIRVELWRKFAFICAHAGMTATTRRPVGDLRAYETTWAMYRRLIEEVCAVARAEGVALPDDTVAEWLDFAEELDPEMYSSLHYDLTHDKPMELDALSGSVVRHADEVGVDVPMNEAVTAILSPAAARRE